MAIHEWPVGERPREKLLAQGPGSLSDAELLAVIIGSGTRGRSAVEVGRDLLKKFGSLRQFLTADRKAVLAQSGIGPAKLTQLLAALELAKRHHLDELRLGPTISSPLSASAFLLAHLRDLPYEVFCCLHLNSRRRFLAFEELFRGTVCGTDVPLREVVRQVMLHNSAGVILAHNHPSGVAEPSEEDEHLTQRLRHVLALVDVEVIDHLVVGDGRCVSFNERGLL